MFVYIDLKAQHISAGHRQDRVECVSTVNLRLWIGKWFCIRHKTGEKGIFQIRLSCKLSVIFWYGFLSVIRMNGFLPRRLSPDSALNMMRDFTTFVCSRQFGAGVIDELLNRFTLYNCSLSTILREVIRVQTENRYRFESGSWLNWKLIEKDDRCDSKRLTANEI